MDILNRQSHACILYCLAVILDRTALQELAWDDGIVHHAADLWMGGSVETRGVERRARHDAVPNTLLDHLQKLWDVTQHRHTHWHLRHRW